MEGKLWLEKKQKPCLLEFMIHTKNQRLRGGCLKKHTDRNNTGNSYGGKRE